MGEVNMLVSGILQKDGRKFVRVSFQRGRDYAEGTLPEGKIESWAGFADWEVQQLERFIQVNREEILEQARILEKEYPDYYEKIRGFLEKMRSGRDQAYLKDGLLKIYRRLSQESNGGRYYEKYP